MKTWEIMDNMKNKFLAFKLLIYVEEEYGTCFSSINRCTYKR